MLAFLALAACATGHCRKPTPAPVPVNDDKKEDAAIRIFISKPDGSLQCSRAKGMPVVEMRKQLKDIEVFSQGKKRDGLMHIELCGSPTGMNNVFEISTKDWPTAEKAGFKKWLY